MSGMAGPRRIPWCLASLACLIAPAGARAEVVRIATGELPPYATAEASDSGTALQIVRRAFALAGHEVRYQFMPWPRAQNETEPGSGTPPPTGAPTRSASATSCSAATS